MNEQTMAFGVTLIAIAVFLAAVVLGLAPTIADALTLRLP